MTVLKFIAWWSGEAAAGLRSGSEEVTIQFKHGIPVDEDAIAYWQDVIGQYFDGAVVELVKSK